MCRVLRGFEPAFAGGLRPRKRRLGSGLSRCFREIEAPQISVGSKRKRSITNTAGHESYTMIQNGKGRESLDYGTLKEGGRSAQARPFLRLLTAGCAQIQLPAPTLRCGRIHAGYWGARAPGRGPSGAMPGDCGPVLLNHAGEPGEPIPKEIRRGLAVHRR